MNLESAKAAILAFANASLGKTVSPEEIARRAKVCAACSRRRMAIGLPARISRMLGIIANKDKSLKPLTESKCGVCQCSLMLLVPARTADLHKDNLAEARRRPGTCWFNNTKE